MFARARSQVLAGLLAALLAGALVACPSTPATPEYRISSLLPSPVTPGDLVTAFGIFPENAKLALQDVPIESAPVPNGLAFTVPKDTLAGEHTVVVTANGVRLQGSIAVNPRVNGAVLEGSSIYLEAVGFPKDLSNTGLLVNGFALSVSMSGTVLKADLPASIVYGGLNISLVVSGRASNVRVLAFEAGAVTGKLTVASLGGQSVPGLNASNLTATQVAPQALPSFLITHSQPLESNAALMNALSQSTSSESITALGVTRFNFLSSSLAKVAFDRVSDLINQHQASVITHLEWDANLKPSDALEVIPSFAPSGSPSVPGSGQWFLALEGIPEAWKSSQGQGVIVAVVDTGVSLEHPDLKANLLPGYDFVDDDPLAADITGHGTHVAGLVAANGKATGVAPQAKILPVRVLRDLTGGSAYTIAQGILWAAGLLEQPANPNPAQVINLSLGSDSYAEVIARAIERVQAKGILVVSAAGNSGGSVAYPAALRGVIAVTALAGPVVSGPGQGVNGSYSLTYQPSYASRGPGTWVTAFGGDLNQDQDKNGIPDGILSTDTSPSGYGLRMGTSMASPQVAGLAALAISGGTQSQFVRSLLAATTTDLGARGYDFNYGHGLISGRLAMGRTPRSYVLAIEANDPNSAANLSGRVVSVALVQADDTFTLGNLPPDKLLVLVAGTDTDGDGLIGEAGEMISGSFVLAVAPRTLLKQDFLLGLSDGRQSPSITMP